MAEIREGIRHLLTIPALYDGFQRMVGAYAWRKRVLQRFALTKLRRGAAILDIGCGTAEIVDFLPLDARYHGFDRNSAYIAKAQRRFASRNVTFRCEEFTGEIAQGDEKYDLVLALGLLHHLDDDQVVRLMNAAKESMTPKGMLLTLDPVFTANQSAAARFLVAHDRGKNVRTSEEYTNLARSKFLCVEAYLDEKPMYIPYTGLVMLCRLK